MIGPRIRACEIKVMQHINPGRLCEEVSRELAEGWELQGLPIAPTEDRAYWAQFLVRTELVVPQPMAQQMQIGGGIVPANIVPTFSK